MAESKKQQKRSGMRPTTWKNITRAKSADARATASKMEMNRVASAAVLCSRLAAADAVGTDNDATVVPTVAEPTDEKRVWFITAYTGRDHRPIDQWTALRERERFGVRYRVREKRERGGK